MCIRDRGQYYAGQAIEAGMPIPQGARVDLEIGVTDKVKGPRFRLKKEEADSLQMETDSIDALEYGDWTDFTDEDYDD